MRSLSLHRLVACIRRPSLWPLFDLPTHLTDQEKFTLYRLSRIRSRSLNNRMTAVEIGSYLGASSSFLAAGMCRENDQMLCVDTWTNDTMTEGNRDTMNAFLANTAPYAKKIISIRGWSNESSVIAKVTSYAREIDLLFIDGDHSYESVLADWNNYSARLVPGAMVVMHDIGWAEGVQRVVNEEIRPHISYESRLPNLWWGQFVR